jgi:ABC-2 type transport system permease protein
MRSASAIFFREFKGYFLSPTAYIVMTVFILPQNWFFYVLMGFLAQGSSAGGIESPMALVLGSNIFLWLVLFAVIPAITMKLFAEEKRSGTIEMLMTAPITEVQVVMGKYLAAFAFYVVMWLPTLSYVVVVWRYGSPDMMKILTGYLGMMLVGAMFLSFGLLASSVTRNQIIAYVIGMLMCVGVLFMNIFLNNLPGMQEFPAIKPIVEYIDLLEHMSHGFSQGIVDTRNVVYYLSLTFLSLFVTVQVAESRKWKG